MLGGVAGGVALRVGVDVTLVRLAFVLLALASGFGVVLYVVAWLALPMRGAPTSIGARALADRRGLALAAAFVPVLVLGLLVGSALGAGLLTTLAWTGTVTAAGLILVWRNAEEPERAFLHQAGDRLLRLGTEPRSRRLLAARVALGVVLFVLGLTNVALGHSALRPWGSLGGALLVVASFVVLFGPWWLRLGRQLVAERQARVRAEERTEMAARIHDSVLQTLALIQRSADQPQRVVQLARAQERELRSWLFEGTVPGALGAGAESVASGLRAAAQEVEAALGVPVEVVTVGDCPLDEATAALVDAAREATMNAAKWSGAPVVSLYGEVEADRVSVFVRDRGKGFDPSAVPPDRKGLAESVVGRIQRQRGSVDIRTSPGQGTEVELHVPRPAGRRP